MHVFIPSDMLAASLPMLLALGLGLLLPYWVNTSSTRHRSALLFVAFVLGARYAWWRATQTLAPAGWTIDMLASWSFFAIELATLIGSASAFLIMARTRNRTPDADTNAGWWGAHEPSVVLLIPTYNEDREILERTIIGARSLRHTRKEILILDDSRRDWLRDYCAELGVGYMRRPDNLGSKAGNINHALARLAERPEHPDFIAVLDADFVPHRGFLARTLALFHDPKLALVQTPQHFFNADPIQHNLGIGSAYPDEQRFFFDHMQPSRDAWGIAVCCGTSSVSRWTALRDLGGLPTHSITEDFMLTLALQERGWTTAYLGEPLTEGLAPEGLKEYITQRARWGLGLMQIARSSMGPFARNRLRLRDRWSVVDSAIFWLTSFTFRIAVIVYPLLYWFFGTIVVDAPPTEVLRYFGTYFVWIFLVNRLIAPGMFLPIMHDVNQLIGAFPISKAAIVGIFRPHGHPFSVTAKGGDRTKVVVQWSIMRPFLLLFGLTILGLTMGLVDDRFIQTDAGSGKWVVLFWTLYNLLVLGFTILACIELPRKERHVADEPQAASLQTSTSIMQVWIQSLTLERARLRGAHLPAQTHAHLSIPSIGAIAGLVVAQTADGCLMDLRPTREQREALLVRFYAEGEAPGVAQARTLGVLEGLYRRLTKAPTP